MPPPQSPPRSGRAVSTPIDRVRAFAVRLAAQRRRRAQGLPPRDTPLVGMTLDSTDAALARSWISLRDRWNDLDETIACERAFASFLGVRTTAAFMSGREALSAILHALDLRPDDQVIVPAYTCIVVPNAVRFAGAQPVFADIELESFGLWVDSVRRRITARTRAIILPHNYGLVGRDTDPILEVAARHRITVIEDCAHAAGARYRQRSVGSLGHAAFFSLERSKSLSTVMGGIAAANDPTLADRLATIRETSPLPTHDWLDRQLRTHQSLYYRTHSWEHPWTSSLYLRFSRAPQLPSISHDELGGLMPLYYGRRMANPIGALAVLQLSKIDALAQRRLQTATFWSQWCDEMGHAQPTILKDSEPSMLRYPVIVDPLIKSRRRRLGAALLCHVGDWFRTPTHPVHTHIPDCPNGTKTAATVINFPCLAFDNASVARPMTRRQFRELYPTSKLNA